LGISQVSEESRSEFNGVDWAAAVEDRESVGKEMEEVVTERVDRAVWVVGVVDTEMEGRLDLDVVADTEEVGRTATTTWPVLLLGLGGDDMLAVVDTTGATTTAALVCTEVTIRPVAVGVVPV
jgi:hypothetical protein